MEEGGQTECKRSKNNRVKKGEGVEECACLKGREYILFQNELKVQEDKGKCEAGNLA